MKKVLLFSLNPDEDAFVSHLVQAYKEGAEAAGAKAATVRINQLHFIPVVDASGISLQKLEPDLRLVRDQILESSHLVFFSEQNAGAFDFKLYSFLNRLFAIEGGLPCKALWQPVDFYNKTVRIISVLDRECWKQYQQSGRRISNPPIRKQHLQLFGISTVRTTALGGVDKGVLNDYYFKWIRKMQLLGKEQY